MNKNTDTMAENTQEKLVSRAQQYGQSLFDHYGKSVDLAAERLQWPERHFETVSKF